MKKIIMRSSCATIKSVAIGRAGKRLSKWNLFLQIDFDKMEQRENIALVGVNLSPKKLHALVDIWELKATPQLVGKRIMFCETEGTGELQIEHFEKNRICKLDKRHWKIVSGNESGILQQKFPQKFFGEQEANRIMETHNDNA